MTKTNSLLQKTHKDWEASTEDEAYEKTFDPGSPAESGSIADLKVSQWCVINSQLVKSRNFTHDKIYILVKCKILVGWIGQILNIDNESHTYWLFYDSQ